MVSICLKIIFFEICFNHITKNDGQCSDFFALGKPNISFPKFILFISHTPVYRENFEELIFR